MKLMVRLAAMFLFVSSASSLAAQAQSCGACTVEYEFDSTACTLERSISCPGGTGHCVSAPGLSSTLCLDTYSSLQTGVGSVQSNANSPVSVTPCRGDACGDTPTNCMLTALIPEPKDTNPSGSIDLGTQECGEFRVRTFWSAGTCAFTIHAFSLTNSNFCLDMPRLSCKDCHVGLLQPGHASFQTGVKRPTIRADGLATFTPCINGVCGSESLVCGISHLDVPSEGKPVTAAGQNAHGHEGVTPGLPDTSWDVTWTGQEVVYTVENHENSSKTVTWMGTPIRNEALPPLGIITKAVPSATVPAPRLRSITISDTQGDVRFEYAVTYAVVPTYVDEVPLPPWSSAALALGLFAVALCFLRRRRMSVVGV